MSPDPREFYQNRIPDQFNRSLDLQQEQAAKDDSEALRILEDMRAVNTSILIRVEGDGGGLFALDIDNGRMTAAPECRHPAFVVIRHDQSALAALVRESGDSALGFLGGLAGLAGEMRLTQSRLSDLADLEGSVCLELTGDSGFSLVTHFGGGDMPDEPDCTIRVDDEAYRDLRAGALPAQEAFMSGRIAIEGDMQLAMQLALAALSPD